MKRLVFVDHSYHQKTRATVFLQELLARRFEVEVIWDEAWNKGPAPDAAQLNAREADAIVFFQSLPKPRTLRALTCRNITWVPMRDALKFRSSRLRRLRASPLKILNFSREAHEYFAGNGQVSLATQYWPPPAAIPRHRADKPSLFFWPRRQEITWNTLKAVLGDFRPARIVLRYASDPGHSVLRPTDHEMREYNITVLEGWMEHDTYMAQLRSCDLFMAPRPLEGIGQAMLEAMNNGLAVIAPDAATMNEYVQPGLNGWLYSLDRPAPLDLSAWQKLADQAPLDVAHGHAAWLAQADAVTEFVATTPAAAARWNWRLLQKLGL